MVLPLRPQKASTYRRSNWLWVPTIADLLEPTVLELTAASALDMSLIFFDDGAPAPTQTTNRPRDKRRYADSGTGESIGATEYSGGDLMMQVNPQAIETDDAKKAWELFLDGARGNWVNRLNVPVASEIIAGQRVTIWPSEVGPALEVPAGEGESAEAAFMCAYAVDIPSRNVLVVAP